MKRFLLCFVILALCVSMISCDELLVGIGNESGDAEKTKENGIESMPPETWYASGTETEESMILVDWSDFVRVNGMSYNGMFENNTVDESLVGNKIGEIMYHVKSSYSSYEELDAAQKRDFTAWLRPIGCEIFEVKNDKNSIAVLDNGKYYLYTILDNASIPFEVFGGEGYSLPSEEDKNRGVTINTFDQLCEAYGGAENMPSKYYLDHRRACFGLGRHRLRYILGK